MAVFTPVSDNDARTLLTQYQLGNLVDLQGIAAGIENTNYFLNTTQGRYVLTLFEVLNHEQLPFYIELMHHLAQHGVPVPEPQTRRNGERLATLHHKPCTIVTRLQGHTELQPGPQHCQQVGTGLARMHLAAQSFTMQQPNLRSLGWWHRVVPSLLPYLSTAQAQLIQDELNAQSVFYSRSTHADLPRGPAHCDLFRDNVLFSGTPEQPVLGGFIDFYFAGCDTWLFDVAVTANDWCIDQASGEFLPDHLQAFLQAYADVRPFNEDEQLAWPMMLRAAAMRFWTSRLVDLHQPREAETLQAHDPEHFERILRLRVASCLADTTPVLP